MSTPHRCPVCGGSGKVGAVDCFGQHVATTAGLLTNPCHACNGTGIVWEPTMEPPTYRWFKPCVFCGEDHKGELCPNTERPMTQEGRAP